MRKFLILVCTAALLCFGASSAFADHPLITEEAETQGTGNFEIEINTEYSHDEEGDVTEDEVEVEVEVSVGIADDVDLTLEIPIEYFKEEENDGVDIEIEEEFGLADIEVGILWVFYEKDDLSLGVKPIIVVPTGDANRELGAGTPSYRGTFIVTLELDPFELHLNLGYEHNRSDLRDIFHASFAVAFEATDDLSIVANIGGESNTDKTTDDHPVFVLGGLIYEISENVAVDIGVKAGLTDAEKDISVLAGIAFFIN